MKEKIGFLIVSILLSVLIALAAMSIALRNNWLPVAPVDNFDTCDSVKVAQIVEQLESPQMYSLKEVVDLQEQMLSSTTEKELFMSLTPDILRSVTSVLLKTEGYVTRESIVREYRANDAIYNNLPPAPNPIPELASTKDSTSAVDLSATDLGNRSDDKLISSSIKKRTDTVNGKPIKVITKTEESYE